MPLGRDLPAAAADPVVQVAHYLATYDVNDRGDEPLDYGLDRGNPTVSGWPTTWKQISSLLTSSI